MLITVLPQAGCGQFEQTQVLWQLSHHHPPASLMHKVISNWKKYPNQPASSDTLFEGHSHNRGGRPHSRSTIEQHK